MAQDNIEGLNTQFGVTLAVRVYGWYQGGHWPHQRAAPTAALSYLRVVSVAGGLLAALSLPHVEGALGGAGQVLVVNTTAGYKLMCTTIKVLTPDSCGECFICNYYSSLRPEYIHNLSCKAGKTFDEINYLKYISSYQNKKSKETRARNITSLLTIL